MTLLQCVLAFHMCYSSFPFTAFPSLFFFKTSDGSEMQPGLNTFLLYGQTYSRVQECLESFFHCGEANGPVEENPEANQGMGVNTYSDAKALFVLVSA